MTHDRRAESRANLSTIVACAFMAVAMVAAALRVVQLQIQPPAKLAEHIQARVTRATLPGVRGEILDRRGRLLSTTRIGYRIFIDPTVFPDPPEAAIIRLADALGVPPEKVGEPLMAKIAQNDNKLAQAQQPEPPEPITLSSVLRQVFGREGTELGDLDGGSSPRLARYVAVGGVLDDDQIATVKSLKIPGVYLERRDIREYPGGPLVASVVGKVGVDPKWSIGAERILNQGLLGQSGKAEYVRDAQGRPLWVEPGHWSPAKRGQDARLSIDLELQRIAHEELMRGIQDADAAGGRCIMLDPLTGEVLAMVDIVLDRDDLVPFAWEPKDPGAHRPSTPSGTGRPRYKTLTEDPGRRIHPALARNRCIEDVYEPGSTFKSFIWAVITERGFAKPAEVFDTEGGRWFTSYGRYIEDVTKRDVMTWQDVLVNSSNIGMVKAGERMSFQQMHEAVTRFGFGSRTNIGLPGEGAGIVTPARRWSKYSQTSVPIGHEVAVTPIQMVRAFATFARPGELAGTLPDVTLRAVDHDSISIPVINRVLPSDVALLTRATLGGVTHNVENRMRVQARRSGSESEQQAANQWRYSIFGKSGTAEIPLGKAPDGMRRPRGSSGYFDGQYNSSFIAAGPTEEPRLVCLVVIDDPGPKRVRERTHYGSMTAGPVVRRAMERALTYLGAPPSSRQDNSAGSLASTRN
ncbi:MAG: penicillin-binding protein 2 [Phycisphaeraceae bacterium]|nr:penicillin-binding protein 2 [Phycisphaeraceae bacterium]